MCYRCQGFAPALRWVLKHELELTRLTVLVRYRHMRSGVVAHLEFDDRAPVWNDDNTDVLYHGLEARGPRHRP